MADDDLIKEALEEFKLCEDAELDNRKEALDDLRFARLGEQWPEAIKRQRELEGRPCLTVNRMPAFIRQVVNDSRQNKPSIIFHPVEDGDVETAEVMNGLMRNIEYTSSSDIAYDTAIDFAVTMGFGYIRVDTDYSYDDAFTQDIKILRVPNPFSIYGDPVSTSADGSDWKVAFVTDTLSKKDFEKLYPSAKSSGGDLDGKAMEWFGEDGIRVAEWWEKDEVDGKVLRLSDGMIMLESDYLKNKAVYDAIGLTVEGERDTKTCKVTQRVISGSEILETNDWAGKYIPIVPVYGDEVNVEGKRHFLSLIRFAKDAQQMHNFWRTASTELVALAPKAPFVGAKGAFDSDAAKWATANTETHAFLEYEHVDGEPPPQRQMFAGVPAGALQEALSASDDMKSIMGLYDSSLGNKSNETSGVAIRARQSQGDVATFHFVDNMTRAIRQVGRICCDLIPKIYSEERVIRVIGENGENEQVKVNGQFEDEMGTVKIHDLTAGKYDLVVKSGPSYATRREEAAAQMMELIHNFPEAAPIIGDLVAQSLDWPGAEKIAERLKLMLPPQLQDKPNMADIPPAVQQQIQQGQQQIQQMQQVIQQGGQENQKLQAENQGLKNKLSANQSELQIKSMETQVKMKELMLKEQEMACGGQHTDAAQIEFDRWKAQLDSDTKVVVAEIGAKTTIQNTSMNLNAAANTDGAMELGDDGTPKASIALQSVVEAINQNMAAMINQAPKRKVTKAKKQPDGTYMMETIEDHA